MRTDGTNTKEMKVIYDSIDEMLSADDRHSIPDDTEVFVSDDAVIFKVGDTKVLECSPADLVTALLSKYLFIDAHRA